MSHFGNLENKQKMRGVHRLHQLKMRNSKGYKVLEVLGGSGFKDFLLSVFSVGMICFRIIPTENDGENGDSLRNTCKNSSAYALDSISGIFSQNDFYKLLFSYDRMLLQHKSEILWRKTSILAVLFVLGIENHG